MGSLPEVPIGRTYGRWTVIGPAATPGKNRRWQSRCECGTERDVLAFQLKKGTSRSCGCLSAELARGRARHGLWNAPEYASWLAMISRCTNPRDRSYASYSERGITVCERWRESVEHFVADMGPKPTAAHTLDRINNDGPYSPENCRWATRKEQARNRRSNHLLSHNGRTMTMSEWAEHLGISGNALYMRLYSGWSVEKALSLPKQRQRHR